MAAPRLVIRADANAEIGFGHVMRCLALGQAWKQMGGDVVFVTACAAERLAGRIHAEGFELHGLDSSDRASRWSVLRAVMDRSPRSCLVLDGYAFDAEDQKCAKRHGYPLVVMDDMADLPGYYADVIVNSSVDAESLRYPCEASTALLTGTQYVLLRQEFVRWREWTRTIPDVAKHVLVTLGGTDACGALSTVLASLLAVRDHDLEIVVAGPRAAIAEAARGAAESRVPVRFETDVDDMAALMAWADVAVSGAGATCLEMAFMGLPNVCIVLADNQAAIGAGLDRHRAAVSVGTRERLQQKDITAAIRGLIEDAARRRAMSAAGRSLIDGYGADRIARECWRRVQ